MANEQPKQPEEVKVSVELSIWRLKGGEHPSSLLCEELDLVELKARYPKVWVYFGKESQTPKWVGPLCDYMEKSRKDRTEEVTSSGECRDSGSMAGNSDSEEEVEKSLQYYGVLLIRFKKMESGERSWYAVTFGQAWRKLKASQIDHEFGRNLAMKIGIQDRIYELEKRSLTRFGRKDVTSDQDSGSLASFDYFGTPAYVSSVKIGVENDFKEDLGLPNALTRVFGSRAFRVRQSLDFPQIVHLIKKLHKVYLDDERDLRWFNDQSVTEVVRDKKEIESLVRLATLVLWYQTDEGANSRAVLGGAFQDVADNIYRFHINMEGVNGSDIDYCLDGSTYVMRRICNQLMENGYLARVGDICAIESGSKDIRKVYVEDFRLLNASDENAPSEDEEDVSISFSLWDSIRLEFRVALECPHSDEERMSVEKNPMLMPEFLCQCGAVVDSPQDFTAPFEHIVLYDGAFLKYKNDYDKVVEERVKGIIRSSVHSFESILDPYVSGGAKEADLKAEIWDDFHNRPSRTDDRFKVPTEAMVLAALLRVSSADGLKGCLIDREIYQKTSSQRIEVADLFFSPGTYLMAKKSNNAAMIADLFSQVRAAVDHLVSNREVLKFCQESCGSVSANADSSLSGSSFLIKKVILLLISCSDTARFGKGRDGFVDRLQMRAKIDLIDLDSKLTRLGIQLEIREVILGKDGGSS